MNFEVIGITSTILYKKGSWKPLFKSRFNDTYFDHSKRDAYESDLRTRIFGYTNDETNNKEVVVDLNAYPFNFGNDIKQYVIWFKNTPSYSPEIIDKIINEHFPDEDCIVYLNKPINRSIKSIDHCHCIIKNPSPEIFLKKLIILHRHANRPPLISSKTFEKIMGNDPDNIRDKNCDLLPIGIENSVLFGKRIKEIYNLNSEFFSNAIYLSSPYHRCRQTLLAIISGLEVDSQPCLTDSKKLKQNFFENFSIKKIKIIGQEYEKYVNLLNKVEDILCVVGIKYPEQCSIINKIRYLENLYTYHSTLQCYFNMGVDTDKYIDKNTQNELADATKYIHNLSYHDYQLASHNKIKRFISEVVNLDRKLIICSTHDTLIFMLVKYLEHVNGINFNLELPDYLSNIRIEYWSDDSVRIFYNNFLLGSKLFDKN